MKRVILAVLFLSLLILNGCIVSSSPSSPIITMDKGDTLDFSVVVSPASCQVNWQFEYGGNVEGAATGLNYTFTPLESGFYQVTVFVTDPNGSTVNRVWVIPVE